MLTEGILTRQMLDDPFLEGVGAVILDEFHERSLHTDVTAALLRQHGIRIFSQHQLEEAGRLLDALDAQDRADSSIGKP